MITTRMRGHVPAALAVCVACACGVSERPAPTPSGPPDAGVVEVSADPAEDAAGPLDVHVVLTADNAYAFGWGDQNGMKNFEARPTTRTAREIFSCPVARVGGACDEPMGCGPEAYIVTVADAPPGAFLYVVAWADEDVTQGVIGQFRRGKGVPLYTGDTAWEVCATGEQHDPRGNGDPGPSRDNVNTKVALCNAGDASMPSKGWVNQAGAVTAGALGNVAAGESNGADRDQFPIACPPSATRTGIEREARWMWYQPVGRTAWDSFSGNFENSTKTYLIFRLPAVDIPLPPVR